MTAAMEDDNGCFGNKSCFRYTFLILAGLCLMGAGLAMLLARRHSRALKAGVSPIAVAFMAAPGKNGEVDAACD